MQPEPKQDESYQFRKNISINTFMAIPFLSLNFYDSAFFAIYMIISIGLVVYKVQKYPFPQYAISYQGVLLCLFALTHYLRSRLAGLAIAQKSPLKLVYYLLVTVFVLPLYVFQLRLQTYVLLGDWVLGWIGIGITVAEVCCAVWVLAVYQRKRTAR